MAVQTRTFVGIVGLAAMLLGTSAGGQSRLASIEGRVVDETGAALPGVTITITSSALQAPRLSDVTGPDGSYRISELPIGEYRANFELAGFRGLVREGVVLTAGFVARVDASLNVGAIEETVTVSGQSPVVDSVTTRGGATIAASVIQTIPNSRNYQDILNMTPGVAVAAPPQMGEVGFRALVSGLRTYGVNGQTQTQVEGLQMSGSAFPDFSTAEQVDIRTFGNTADVASPGAVTDLIVKSGSNTFHSRYHEQYMNDAMQAENLDEELIAQGLRTGDGVRFYQDFAGDLGGRVVRDRLWFYGAFRDVRNERSLAGYSHAPGPDGLYGSGDDEPGFPPAKQSNQTIKITSQLTPGNRLIGFWQRNWVNETEAQASRFIPYEATREVQWEPVQYKVEWQATPSSRFFLNASYGRTSEDLTYIATTQDAPARFDRRTNLQTGAYAHASNAGRDDEYHNLTKRHLLQGSATMYPGELLGGSHEVKVGFRGWIENADGEYLDRASGNYRLIYDAGQPVQIQTYNYPVEPRDRMREYAPYVMDQWRITPARLTVNLGLRWERTSAFSPDQTKSQGAFGTAGTFPRQDAASWNSLAPRTAVAWDVTGMGKTVLKATYGWFNHRSSAATLAGTFNLVRPQAVTYTWRDLDVNNDYTPGIGEVDLALNGPDFVSINGANNALINPDLEQPRTHEITAAFEREVGVEASLRVLYVFRQTNDEWESVNVLRPYGAYDIPITRRDPGPDGRLHTGDDAGSVTFHDYDPEYRGAAFVGNMFVTRPNSDRFHTLEATYTKRQSGRWSLIASGAVSRNHRWLDAIPESPNDEFFPLDETWEWNFKLAGNYRLPWSLEAAALYDIFNGDYGQRTYLFGATDPDGGTPLRQLTNQTLRLEEFGARQGPTRHNLNFRASRSFALPRGHRIRGEVDLLNALNTNVAWGRGGGTGASTGTAGIDYRSGPTFGYVTQIVAPRVLRLGVVYEF